MCEYPGDAVIILIEILKRIECEHRLQSMNKIATDHGAQALEWPIPKENTKELCWINTEQGRRLGDISGKYVQDGDRSNTLIPVSKHEGLGTFLSEEISEGEVMVLMNYSVWN